MKFAGDVIESQRRRDAVRVQLQPRPGRVDELPPGEVAGELALPEQARAETVMEEEASGRTDLPMRTAVDKEQQDSANLE